ncbi:MAG: glycine zipper 2TM domain-containing protein [Cellvibrionaceae bacterium]
MNKKLIPIIVSSLGLTLAAVPFAQAEKSKRHYQDYNNDYNETVDYAKVVNVKPIYETVEYSEPYKECHYEERVVRKRRGSDTAIILGSLIGGAIGNELGHNKSNKRVGTVAGAILGGSIAKDIHRSKRGYHVRDEKVCTTAYQVNYKEELRGYDVAYKYRGKTYYTTMDQHPGKKIRVAVSVRPL